jgi:hypothetical protein
MADPAPNERVFIEAYGLDDDALRDGLKWLASRSQSGGHNEAAIVVNGVSNIKNLASIPGIGGDGAAQLKKERALHIDGFKLRVFPLSQLPASYEHPVLAVHLHDKELVKVDALGADGICVVPWNFEYIQQWKENWRPTDLRTGQQAGAPDSVTNQVVAAALTELLRRPGVTTHSNDRAAAIQMFRILRDAGQLWNPDQVRAFAVRGGWEPEEAGELADIAQGIADGKALRGGQMRMWNDQSLDRWKAAADTPTESVSQTDS